MSEGLLENCLCQRIGAGWPRGGYCMFHSVCKNHFISLISLAALRMHNESQDCCKMAFPQLSSPGIS